ncbi:MAG: hypothetical protein AAF152_04490 [Cyanobacteria bacterium P01_A01_bin.114]
MASSSGRVRPLNVGNVVTAGLKLYGANRKQYLKIALKAYLWILVPVYGWAKYLMLSALIARLAFKEVIGEPESPAAGRRELQPRMWSFLLLGLLIGLIFVGVYFALSLVSMLAAFVVGGLIGFALSAAFGSNIGAGAGFIIGALVFLVVFLPVLLWLVTRWLLAEVPLALEESTDPTVAISRSWKLTKNSTLRLVFVVTVAFLVSLPILLLTNYLPQIPLYLVEPFSPQYWLIYFCTLIVSFIGGILLLPFWQAIKAVLYYDLRSRQEGLDIEFRGRGPTDASV